MSDALHERLGAGPPAGVRHVTLFVPSVDRDSEPIDQAYWAEQVLDVFGRLFRGATAFPPGRGVWRDDARGGRLVYEDTQMVVAYVEPDLLEEAAVIHELRLLLSRIGRETNQGEVGIVIDGEYFGVVDYTVGSES